MNSKNFYFVYSTERVEKTNKKITKSYILFAGFKYFTYLCIAVERLLLNKHRGVEQLVARQAHNLEVTCSSRVSATILKRCKEIPYTSFSFVVVQLLLVSRSVWADVWAQRKISGG